jgi:hypothetical protein
MLLRWFKLQDLIIDAGWPRPFDLQLLTKCFNCKTAAMGQERTSA